VKGWYYRGYEDDFTYTLDITIAAAGGSTPEPEPEPAVNLKLIEFQVPAEWEEDYTPISSADFPGFVATTYEIASALPVTSENPLVVVYDFPGNDELSAYSKMGEQVELVTGTYLRGAFFNLSSNFRFYYPVLADDEPEPEPEPATTYNVTFTGNSNVKVVENITLPHTFSCNFNDQNGELDHIIQELYGIALNEGWCDDEGYPWMVNPVNGVTADISGSDHYITISAPFEGTAQVKGWYYRGYEDDFTYTLDITIAAAGGSTPEPETTEQEITPNVDPENPTVYYSTFYDSANKYALPAGVEAYVADLSGANLLLTKIAEAGEVIPADNAVILKSTVTPFTLTPSDAAAVTFTATNDLQGSDTQIATPANCYVLAGTDGVVGFYHYTAANLNAHKAYVVYSGSNQAPRRMPFIFDQATGVENVQNSDIRSQKVVENGQLIIIRNGVRYNAAGQNVK